MSLKASHPLLCSHCSSINSSCEIEVHQPQRFRPIWLQTFQLNNRTPVYSLPWESPDWVQLCGACYRPQVCRLFQLALFSALNCHLSHRTRKNFYMLWMMLGFQSSELAPKHMAYPTVQYCMLTLYSGLLSHRCCSNTSLLSLSLILDHLDSTYCITKPQLLCSLLQDLWYRVFQGSMLVSHPHVVQIVCYHPHLGLLSIARLLQNFKTLSSLLPVQSVLDHLGASALYLQEWQISWRHTNTSGLNYNCSRHSPQRAGSSSLQFGLSYFWWTARLN